MTLSAFLDKVKPLHLAVISLVLVSGNIIVNMFIPEEIRGLFNPIFGLCIAFFTLIGFIALYKESKQKDYSFRRTIFILGLSSLVWTLGDAFYLILIIIGVDPFVSFNDIFYISATLLVLLAVFTIPSSLPPSRRRNMVFIEISILFLSATIIFIVLLLVPGTANLNYDWLTMLMVFIYPVLDIILLWVIVILFFTYPNKSSQKVLGILLGASLFLLVSDMLYLVNSLYSNVIDDYIIDIGYYFFYVFILAAALVGYKEIRQVIPDPETEKKIAPFKQGNWIVFLPGVFLISLIGLLMVFVLTKSFVLFHGVIILIALIVILFIIHQYLVIADNIKLTKEMRLINTQLESKVEERTSALSKANEELLEEMTERKKAEDHLAQINKQLALVNREKDKLFSIMAHDLRSPLGSMMKLSELLVDNFKDFDEEELAEITGTLHKSATQTFQLLNDLLDWSAVQMGRGESKKETFNIFDTINEVVALIEPESSSKQITIKVDSNPEHTAFADKFAIQTVLRNLLNNATKFTPEGGLISIDSVKDVNNLVLSVADNGTGMTKEKQKKIFRVDAVSSTPGTQGEKGSGFGLLLCKDLVEKNGGTIWLESEKGKGSTFSFTLPLPEDSIELPSGRNAMPGGRMEYKSDHIKKLAFNTLFGDITLDFLRVELSLLWTSIDFKPDYSVLIDVRQANLKMEIKDFPDIIRIFADMPSTEINRKFALLTSTPQQVAYSTMFGQSLRKKYPLNVEIFSTYEAALSWLGE